MKKKKENQCSVALQNLPLSIAQASAHSPRIKEFKKFLDIFRRFKFLPKLKTVKKFLAIFGLLDMK